MQIRLVLPLAALVLAVAAPPAHSALTLSRDGASQVITVTGDGTDETLTVGVNDSQTVLTHSVPPSGNLVSANDWDPVTAGEQVVPAATAPNDAYTLAIDMGAGNDVVTIGTDKLEAVTASLGDGDDLFFGSTTAAGRTADTIDGGAGDDRIVGGRGDDTMLGGDGNDTLVWNNGDNSDSIDGQGGTDTAEVNGSLTQGDDFIARPGDGGKLRFERTNLIPFVLAVATTTERMQVNALGGNDKIETVTSLGVSMGLDGGTGEDNLIGGEAADVLSGGDDNDKLTGGGGDDVLAGNRGDDSMSGGEGSDRLVWNNGDNTDTADGDSGPDVMEVNGAPGGGDAFTVAPDGTRAKLDRTNLVPFTVSFTAEALDLNMLAGNDTVTVAGGTPTLIDADGGSGDDALTGAEGWDVLAGGAGNDTVTGGGGSDLLAGDDGNDTIAARDDAADFVRCGAGTDAATLDGAAVDAATDCETADRPATSGTPGSPGTPGGPAAAAIRILSTKVKVAKGRAAVSLQCPAGATACTGELSLATAKAVRIGRARVIVALGTAKFSVAAGKTATVNVRLPKTLKAIARKAKSLKARAVAGTAAGGGASLTTVRAVTLSRPAKGW